MLLDKSNFSEEQKVLILSIALSKVQEGHSITPEYIEAAMRRIQGANSSSGQSASNSNDIFESEDFSHIDYQSLSTAEKDELIEHAMYTWQNKRYPTNWNGNKRPYSGKQPSYSYNFRGGSTPPNRRYPSPRGETSNGPMMNPRDNGPMMNPRDIQTGEIMRCHGCNSRFHLYRSMKCPNNAKVLLTERNNAEENLNVESIYASECDFKANYNSMTGYGVLDSAATKTVCGKQWFDNYRDYLTSIGKHITVTPSNVCYKFGNDGQKKSLFAAVIPIYIFGQYLNLHVDVISSNCPLLMGRPTLEKLGLVLNFKNCTALINDKTFPLQRSEKGHFLASLMFTHDRLEQDIKVDNTVYLVDELNEIYFSESEIDDACEIVYSVAEEALHDTSKTARKLHLIFGHPSSERLNRTLQLGLKGVDQSKVKSLCKAIDEYTKSCKTCKDTASHNPKPKVCLPLAVNFNDVVAFDITFWTDPQVNKSVMILHLIDVATRLSAATVIHSKDPKHITDSLVSTWLNVFGPPKKSFTDNGGEFANKQLVELVENLGIEFKATAAESSFSNGINERHHAIIKSILNKIRHDYKSTSINILLSYAVFAKNCLVDNRGFTPHQRVYGRSPNVPSVLSENVCNSNTEYESDEVRKHLNLLHDTRQAYMSAESSDRIKRALKSRIYVSEAPFYYGEKNFYWKESQDKASKGWKGPATIIGSEGKVIVVRHGSFIHRCHETKVRRASEGCSLLKDDTNNDTPAPNLVFPITPNNETSSIHNDVAASNENVTATPENVSTNHNISLETNITNTNTVNNHQETSENHTSSVDKDHSNTEPRVQLRPRCSIKPASKYGFDDVYEFSDDETKIAKMKELNSWKMHEVYKEIEVNEAINPLITTRWVFNTKENNDKSTYLKVRLVIRGFQDIEKDTVVSESSNAHTESLKLTLALLRTLRFRPKKMDISTAFLQGKTLSRAVYVKPPVEAEVDETKCWRF